MIVLLISYYTPENDLYDQYKGDLMKIVQKKVKGGLRALSHLLELNIIIYPNFFFKKLKM